MTGGPRRTDRGLQPERTTLAWQRTSISFLAAALLFLRWAATHGPVVTGVVLLAALVSAWTFARTRARLRHTAAHFPDAPESAALDVAVVTVSTAVLGATALWVALAT